MLRDHEPVRDPGRRRLQTGVEGLRDALRVGLGKLGPRAGEQLVHRGAPQPEPSLEVPGSETDPRVQSGMGCKRATAVGASPEKDRLPEGRDLRHVCFHVELGDVDKDPPDHRINQSSAVEGANESFTIGAIVDIAQAGGHAGNKDTAGDHAISCVRAQSAAGTRSLAPIR
jgi:hypothetical protein